MDWLRVNLPTDAALGSVVALPPPVAVWWVELVPLKLVPLLCLLLLQDPWPV